MTTARHALPKESPVKNAVSNFLRANRKAIAAGVMAGLVAAWPLVSKDHSLSTNDIYAIVAAAAAGAGLTWLTPANVEKPKDS